MVPRARTDESAYHVRLSGILVTPLALLTVLLLNPPLLSQTPLKGSGVPVPGGSTAHGEKDTAFASTEGSQVVTISGDFTNLVNGKGFCLDKVDRDNVKASYIVAGKAVPATLRDVCKQYITLNGPSNPPDPQNGILLQFPTGQIVPAQYRPMRAAPQTKPSGAGEETKGEPLLLQGDFSELIGAASKDCDGSSKSIPLPFRAVLYAGISTVEGTVEACSKNLFLIVPNQPGRVVPYMVAIENTNTHVVFDLPFEPPVVFRPRTFVFFSPEFVTLCNNKVPVGCAGTSADKINAELSPTEGLRPGSTVKITGLYKDMAVVQAEASLDYRPDFLIATRTDTGETVRVRDLPGPRRNRAKPNVSFTVVDPDTIEHNFGGKIASRYVVVDLEVFNPGPKKVQVHKSAVWFDVDYIAADRQAPRIPQRHHVLGRKAPIYDAQPAAYPSPCDEGSWLKKKDAEKSVDCQTTAVTQATKKPRIYRYGIDHSYQHFPEVKQAVLGTYDDTSRSLHTVFDAADVIVGGAAGLGEKLFTGKSYSPVVSTVSAIILPAGRKVFLDEEKEKRLRANLVDQSFEDIIQIPSFSSVTTKVFLPRRPVELHAPELVVLYQVRDVHLELEVVTEAIEEIVVKGELRLGMTMDQVLQSLGVPNRTETTNAGTNLEVTVWYYDVGAYESVQFSREHKVIAFKERSADEQLMAELGQHDLKNDEVVNKYLGRKGPDKDKRRPLVDGGELWILREPLTKNLRFDKAGMLKKSGVGYEPACEKLKKDLKDKQKGLKDAAVKNYLKDIASGFDAEAFDKSVEKLPKNPPEDQKNRKLVFPSPDIKDQLITITYVDNKLSEVECGSEPTEAQPTTTPTENTGKAKTNPNKKK